MYNIIIIIINVKVWMFVTINTIITEPIELSDGGSHYTLD